MFLEWWLESDIFPFRNDKKDCKEITESRDNRFLHEHKEVVFPTHYRNLGEDWQGQGWDFEKNAEWNSWCSLHSQWNRFWKEE